MSEYGDKKYRPFGGNDEYSIPVKFESARHLTVDPQSRVIPNEEYATEITDIWIEKCHKGEAMNDKLEQYIIPGEECPYDGEVKSFKIRIKDVNTGKSIARIQWRYLCNGCLNDQQKRKRKQVTRTREQVQADVTEAKKRFNPVIEDKANIPRAFWDA